MIYLTTGANGAGKTLLTLHDVRQQQLKEGRPVYYHGFEMDPAKAQEFGWQPFDPKDWQSLPDGSICVMDECQNEFPLRRSGSEVPDYINAIAQHRRRRGFDFWLICPHPSLIDVFIRRLIGKPSWHRHLVRAFGADMVSVRMFDVADMKCEEPGAGARAQVTMRGYPKEVYTWYKSASLHTGKRSIPKQLYVLGVAALAVPALFWFGYHSVQSNVLKGAEPAKQEQAKPATAGSGQLQQVPTQSKPVRTVAEYMQDRRPRIDDFPHTAPAYDQVTQPTTAPYPAACVKMGERCDCYSQQGTKIRVSFETCSQIVTHGFFVDWQQPQQQPQQAQQRVHLEQPPDAQAQPARTVPAPHSWQNPRADARPPALLPLGAAVQPEVPPGYSWPKNPGMRMQQGQQQAQLPS